jgi:hypothetical protein
VESNSQARVEYLVKAFEKVHMHAPTLRVESQQLFVVDSFNTPFLQTFQLLLQRHLVNLSRQPLVMSTRITQLLFFGLILGCMFAPLRNNQESVQDRIGLMNEVISAVFIGMLSCIAIFPAERNVFYREHMEGLYGPLPFILAYVAVAIPFSLVSSAMFCFIVVYATGLSQTFEVYALFTYCCFWLIMLGEFLGVAFCAVFFHIGFSVNLVSVFLAVLGVVRVAHPAKSVPDALCCTDVWPYEREHASSYSGSQLRIPQCVVCLGHYQRCFQR